MSFVSTLKKSLIAFFFTLVGGLFLNPGNVTHAGNWFTDLFTAQEQGISFTQYEGQLAQLSTKGFDSALVASTDAKEFILKIVNFALGFLALLAVLIVIYGGVLYVTAAGEDEKAGKGKKAIAYAAIGLLIVLGSVAFVNTIIAGGTGGKTNSNSKAVASGGSFNASTEEVRTLAFEVYNGFKFLEETTQDLKNIKNDAEKDSINPNKLPGKNEIIKFLYSVKEKLNTILSKMQKFSGTSTAINNLIRDIAKDIDTINSLNEVGYIKHLGNTSDSSSAQATYCDPEQERENIVNSGKMPDSLELYLQNPLYQYQYTGLTNPGMGGTQISSTLSLKDAVLRPSDAEICAAKGYNTTYTKGLYEAWYKINKKYTGGSANQDENILNIYSVINPIAKDYAEDLKRIFGRLDELYSDFSNIDAVQGGKAGAAYKAMFNSSGYGYTKAQSGGGVGASNGGLLAEVESWNLGGGDDKGGSAEKAGPFVLYGLKNQATLFNELSTLKYVDAHLTANVTNGSAPLIVMFDTLGTIDPAGGSIKGTNITWDLAGTQNMAQFLATKADEADNKSLISNESVECTLLEVPDKEKQLIGDTAKRCVFKKPGTYTAAIKIDSNEPTKYAPGVTAITIKVAPPKTKIDLTISPPTPPQVMMRWNKDQIVTDNSVAQITLSDAEVNVNFNAGGTPDSKQNQYKWDYGNGKIDDFKPGADTGSTSYKKAGKYVVTLDVINPLGENDKKIFTMEISSIVARINPTPADKGRINTTVTFDGSSSKSDIGKIANYEWTIAVSPNQADQMTPEAKEDLKIPFTDSGTNLKTIKREFKYPLKYDITLKVTDDTGKTSTTTLSGYQIVSQPPVAAFSYDITDKTQPSTVHFDGSKSYDPDATTDFTYHWSIEPKTDSDFDTEPTHGPDSQKPIIKFKKKGDYKVTLTVRDPNAPKEFMNYSKSVKIDNILDVAWKKSQQITAGLDDNAKAKVDFEIDSPNAKAYDIDYGDGQVASGDLGSEAISHEYTKIGKYLVKLTVTDADNKENTIEKKIFVSGGKEPIAKIGLTINGEEVLDPSDSISNPIEVSKKDILLFNADASKNTDGTDKNLKYSWSFDDGKSSSKKRITHPYKEISPKDKKYYTVKLLVTDDKDPSKSAEDEISINVINKPPMFTSVQGVPQSGKTVNVLTTPVLVDMKAYGAEDQDGNIIKYRWWYFDAINPSEPLGIQITTNPSAILTIGTQGKEGDKIIYGFGLEVTDNDGLTYSNQAAIDAGDFSKINITNGPNQLPTAKITVSQTSVFIGDEVSFTSASTDPDGQIVSYIWDTEGDGFQNNEPTKESTVKYKYAKMNKQGYETRLKIIDDKGGEAVTGPVRIYVDSIAKPPVADFDYEGVKGSGGMKIKFTNKSSADDINQSHIIGYIWDFDINSNFEGADSDMDGKKDDDINSMEQSPERLFTKPFTYKVKLTITDDHGNKDEVTKSIKVPVEVKEDVIPAKIVTPGSNTTDVPSFNNKQTGTNGVIQSALGLETTPAPAKDSVIYLSGNSGSIKFDFSKSFGYAYYIIDKNINFDTDGDGKKANDEDFKTPLPGTWTTNFDKSWGDIEVKLYAKSISGNEEVHTNVKIKFAPN